MQIKRFEARDMTTALGLIKQEFGPDAVILSAKTLKPSGSLLGKSRSSRVAVTAAIDPALAPGGNAQRRTTDTSGEKATGAAPVKRRAARQMLANLNQRVHTIYGRDGKPKKKNDEELALVSAAEVVDLLTDQGVGTDVAEDVGRHVASHQTSTSTDSLQRRLARVLADRRLVAGGLRTMVNGPVVAAVIGNAGSGKTTVAAKWAAIQSIDYGRRVGIISLDDRRVGAGDQIRTLARLIDVPVQVVDTHMDLERVLAEWSHMDFIFIDTPGLSLNHPDRYHRICGQLSGIAGLSLHLVVNAATHSRETRAAMERFDQLPVHSVVMTHLDTCRLLGQMIDTIWTHNVPISYVSAGDIVPDDIQALTADDLAALALNGDRTSLMTAQPESPVMESSEFQTSKEEQEEEEPPADPASAPFLANNNSDIYHRSDCKWTAMIKPENTIAFHSTDEADQKGFAPCRYCRPADLETATPPRRVAHC